MKTLKYLAILVLAVGCTKFVNAQQATSESAINQKYGKLLNEGVQKLANGNAKDSINNYFNPIISYYESHYKKDGKREYSSRGTTETLFYLLQAATEKQSAIVISQLWADAYYFKGYATLELRNINDAKIWIEKALEFSPSNSGYLSELGYIYQLRKDWNGALNIFKKSEEAAHTYTPEKIKRTELLKAMRGTAYVLVELGRLEEAEKKYLECLKINKNDKKSLSELEYVRNLRRNGK